MLNINNMLINQYFKPSVPGYCPCTSVFYRRVCFIMAGSNYQNFGAKQTSDFNQIVFYTPIMKVDFMCLIFLFFNEYTDENKIIIMIILDTNLNACVRCVTLISYNIIVYRMYSVRSAWDIGCVTLALRSTTSTCFSTVVCSQVCDPPPTRIRRIWSCCI